MNRSRCKLSAFAAAGLTLGFTACGGSNDAPRAAHGIVPQECTSRTEGSRWASGAAEYTESATYGTAGEDDWIEEIGGIASLDSLVFMYDAGRARIVALDQGLRPVRVLGREGRGPGELKRERDMGWRGRGWRWLDVTDGKVAVFDGTRIQLFTPDGSDADESFRGAVRSGAVTFETDRLRFWDGELVAASGGYRENANKGTVPNTWTLYRNGDRTSRPILSLVLTPRPADANGIPFTGPEQALPVWDMSNGCIVAGDGTDRLLVRSDLEGRAVDTLQLAIPDLGRPVVDAEQMGRLLGLAGKGRRGGFLPPSAVRQVELITIDPDGYVWILPVQDSAAAGSGVEILRMSLQSGAVERDTVPAFPLAFGQPGVFYARGGDREEPVIARFQLDFSR